METSRYASRLAINSPVLPSGRPLQSQGSDNSDLTSTAPEIFRSSLDVPQEPDDASLTGGTRSLSRRLLALNIPGLSAVQPAVNAARRISGQKQNTRKLMIGRNMLVPKGLTPKDA